MRVSYRPPFGLARLPPPVPPEHPAWVDWAADRDARRRAAEAEAVEVWHTQYGPAPYWVAWEF